MSDTVFTAGVFVFGVVLLGVWSWAVDARLKRQRERITWSEPQSEDD